MLLKIKNLSSDSKTLLSNFFSLSVLQGINMILPLVTLPYLTRVLGVEKFGLINFVLSIIMYFNILVSFGFELSATREISVNRDNLKKVSEIFSSVMLIKLILALLSFLILLILTTYIDSFNQYSALYFVTFGLIIGNLLAATWFFQGMEKMKYITYINVSSRVFFTILIFVFVKDSSDYMWVPLLNSIGALVAGVYSVLLIFRMYNIKLKLPTLDTIIYYLKDSYYFFLSRVANNGSRYYAITIIGIYFGNTIVGYYSMVEKLFYAFLSLGGIVSQTIYPYMSRTKNIKFFKKLLFAIILLSTVMLIFMIYFNKDILLLVFGIENQVLINIFLLIFSGAIFAIASIMVGYPFLAAFGYIKYANNSLIYASIIYIAYITIVTILFKNIYLTVLSLMVYELSGLIFRLYYINRVKYNLHKEKNEKQNQ